MLTSRLFAVVSLGLTLPGTVGCGGSNCQIVWLNVTPQTAAANHTAAAPSNSQTFIAVDQFNGACQLTAGLINSNWTASDPSVHLSASPTTQVTASPSGSM